MNDVSGETMDATELLIRKAERKDLEAIVALFANDPLGGHGDTTDPEAFADYAAAFDRIEASTLQTLFVAVLEGQVRRHFSNRAAHVSVGAWKLQPDRRSGPDACGHARPWDR